MIVLSILTILGFSTAAYIIWWLSAKVDAQARLISTLLKNEQVLLQNQETLQKDLTRLVNEFKAVQKEINRKQRS